MRQRFASDTYEHAKKRRLRKIAGRSSAELTRAFETGQISLRQYDLVSRNPKARQRRMIEVEQRKSVAALTAAQVIEELLRATKPGTPIRLPEITTAIRNALRTPGM
jgi:hypothetical protein